MSALPEVVARLVAGERVSVPDPELRQQLVALGVEVGSEVGAGDECCWPEAVTPLDTQTVEQALTEKTRAWLRELRILPTVGSTNSLLLERAGHSSVDGVVITAECQLGGRGRLGRHWLSPLGTNLAVSIGLRLPLEPTQLGGLTLAVGLALLEALNPDGKLGLALKWPNDVLGPEGKLAGILVELAGHSAAATELVVGIGVNLAVPRVAVDQVGQAVQNYYDLPAAERDRNKLLGAVVSQVVEFSARFAEAGFRPFVEAFNQHHRLQGQPCTVTGPAQALSGQVLGVDGDGCLLLETADGTERVMSGEVSVRGV